MQETEKISAERPALDPRLTAKEFASWYWLKSELVQLCRLHGLRSAGSKLELEARIRGHLGVPLSGESSETRLQPRRAGKMPSEFGLDTVIGTGWRCNPSLGAFFRGVCGRGFRFNAAMRDYIHNGAGKTLADAAVCFHASVRPDAERQPIARQLEYNQHFREYFLSHPGANRDEAIAAWWQKRTKRNGTRSR